jgi:GDPmannose 4,6-dehydratase
MTGLNNKLETVSKKAFITGITGQDGSYLAEFLLDKGYEVIGLARSQQYSKNISFIEDKIKLYYGDVSDSSLLLNILATHRPDEIYNFAAISHIQDCWESPGQTLQVNSIAPSQIINLILKLGLNSKFLQATSREIYGNYSGLINEETPYSTENPYAVSKLAAHLMIDSYRRSHGIFACSAILFNHESPRRPTKFVTRKVTNFAKNVQTKNARLKLGNLDAQRDWGFAGDFVEGMWLMLQHDKPNDYVLATKNLYSIRELCEMAFSYRGLDYKDYVETDQEFMRKNEVEAPIGDYTKAYNQLGWKPKVSFEDLIKLMIDKEP